MKAGFISLGCAKNLVDTEVMLGIMREHGIDIQRKKNPSPRCWGWQIIKRAVDAAA